MQALAYVKTLPDVAPHIIQSKSVVLPKPRHPRIKKTIIFDMDETLIHCVEDVDNDNPDVVLTIEFPTGEIVDAGINIRPFAIDCMKQANKNFQVVVFTASH